MPERIPDTTRLGRNFTAVEFRRNDGVRLPIVALPALRRLVQLALQPARHRFGVCTVNSSWRTNAHNDAVGGAPLSFHLWHLRHFRFGCADVTFERGTPAEWAAFARACRIPGIGIYDTHVHLDMRPGPQTVWHG